MVCFRVCVRLAFRMTLFQCHWIQQADRISIEKNTHTFIWCGSCLCACNSINKVEAILRWEIQHNQQIDTNYPIEWIQIKHMVNYSIIKYTNVLYIFLLCGFLKFGWLYRRSISHDFSTAHVHNLCAAIKPVISKY